MNTHLTDTELQQIVEEAAGYATEKQSEHLNACSLCTAKKNEYEILFGSLKEMESVLIPESFSEGVIGAVEEIREKRSRVVQAVFYISASVIAFIVLLITVLNAGGLQGASQSVVLSLCFTSFVYVCIIEGYGLLHNHKATLEDITL